LKVAEGTFAGFVNFSESSIQKIGDLRITAPDQEGFAAYFNKCLNLKIAEGTFPGLVNFDGAGIKKVGNLKITKANDQGYKANFIDCDVRLSKDFLGPEYLMDDETRQINLSRIAAAVAQKGQPDIEI
jgi:hypothetical protein